jgi:hypothetical protein
MSRPGEVRTRGAAILRHRSGPLLVQATPRRPRSGDIRPPLARRLIPYRRDFYYIAHSKRQSARSGNSIRLPVASAPHMGRYGFRVMPAARRFYHRPRTRSRWRTIRETRMPFSCSSPDPARLQRIRWPGRARRRFHALARHFPPAPANQQRIVFTRRSPSARPDMHRPFRDRHNDPDPADADGGPGWGNRCPGASGCAGRLPPGQFLPGPAGPYAGRPFRNDVRPGTRGLVSDLD